MKLAWLYFLIRRLLENGLWRCLGTMCINLMLRLIFSQSFFKLIPLCIWAKGNCSLGFQWSLNLILLRNVLVDVFGGWTLLQMHAWGDTAGAVASGHRWPNCCFLQGAYRTRLKYTCSCCWGPDVFTWLCLFSDLLHGRHGRWWEWPEFKKKKKSCRSAAPEERPHMMPALLE